MHHPEPAKYLLLSRDLLFKARNKAPQAILSHLSQDQRSTHQTIRGRNCTLSLCSQHVLTLRSPIKLHEREDGCRGQPHTPPFHMLISATDYARVGLLGFGGVNAALAIPCPGVELSPTSGRHLNIPAHFAMSARTKAHFALSARLFRRWHVQCHGSRKPTGSHCL